MIYVQVKLPEEIDKKIKVRKIEKGFKYKGEAIVDVLKEYYGGD